MVQLRDEETHEPLPGITLGDMGAKFGMNSLNNGYLGFNNYRIPRSNMFTKYAQVLEDGTYVKSKNNKLIYGSMVFVRVALVFDGANQLSRAATIATRYSAVRRQSPLKADEPEVQIISFLTQQHKLFIAISTAYALEMIGWRLWDMFINITDELSSGNFERLSEIHAVSCCLKATSTADTAFHVGQCRLACGGNGILTSSNLPSIYVQAVSSCTYEGDNTVLLLQTARFLLKSWQQVDSGFLPPTVQYLKNAKDNEANTKWENTVYHIIRAFELMSMRKIATCTEAMQKRVATGASFEEAWNLTSVQLVAAAEVHSRLISITFFNEVIKNASKNLSSELSHVMNQLVELYAVYWALQKLADLLQYTCISESDVADLRAWYEEILCQLRPNAVGLVDAFDFSDYVLNSSIGSSDGRVYERLIEETQRNPLNKESVNSTFQKYLKPLMKGKL